MAVKPKILCIGDESPENQELLAGMGSQYEVVLVPSPLRALVELRRGDYAAVLAATRELSETSRLGRLLQNERILEGMPDGIVVLDLHNTVLWGNARLHQWIGRESIEGLNFYAAFGSPEIIGPDFCPFHTALATGEPSSSKLRCQPNRYYHVHAAPVLDQEARPELLIVTVRDITEETLQHQKLEAIHQAGIQLADMKPEEVFHLAVEDRIELLKSNIVHFTKDVLNFDVIEIRLLEQKTGQLVPLLSVGLEPTAASRPLFAQPQQNGVTGFVAATRKSYLCEDTTEDPLYIEGFKGAKSSLTVPLLHHDQVIGTFNVESPEPGAFTESDLQFLEIFSRDLAAALNTLELLVAQQANTAQASVEAIHCEVALPVDEILNDVVNVMERYIGHAPDVAHRLHRILRNARDIKQVIHKVGEKMTPAEAVPETFQRPAAWPRLRGLRVLVADADESVRGAAHTLLERYGCIVETAHEGGEALLMVRNSGPDAGYDVIIADARMPDMTGYELLVRLQEVLDPVPLVLMTGFGYDPEHVIVKARQAGLVRNAVLYKPFRLDQLVETVDSMSEITRSVSQS